MPPLRRAFRATGFAAITASMLPAYAVRNALAGDDTRDDVRDRWVRRWSTALLRLFSIDVTIVGDIPRSTRGRLVVSNHRSTIDVGVLLQLFGGHMVSRGDLSGWPLLGPAARIVGTVFVDRKDAASGAGAIREIRHLLDAGQTVIIFPEGTTFAGDEVRPFHPGAFVAARGVGADIVPLGIAYETGSGAAFVGESFLAHLSRVAAGPPTRMVACIGAPIPTGDRARAADLRDRTHQAVQALVNDARACVDRRG